MLRFTLLAALIIMVLGILFAANFGIIRVTSTPRQSLLEEVEGSQNRDAVQRYIDQSNLRKNQYMQQLILVSIVGLAVVMVFFHTTVINRVTSLQQKLKQGEGDDTPLFEGESGSDEISLLSQEISSVLKRNDQLRRDGIDVAQQLL